MTGVFDLSLVQLAVFAFFTGMGTTFGTEIAKDIIGKLKVKVNHK